MGGCRGPAGRHACAGFRRIHPNGATEEQSIGWAVEVMKRAAEYSGSRGIIVGVEDDGGLTTNAKPTIEIVKRTDRPGPE